MKRTLGALIIMVSLFAIISTGINTIKNSNSLTFSASENKTVSQMKVGDNIFNIYIAKTSEQQSKGLSGIKAIKDNEAMLFPFSPATIPSFWMKDMLFSIDIIWIHNGKVVDISKNLPVQKDVSTSELPTYSPSQNVDYALEVNSGISSKVKVGDEVVLYEINET